MGLLTEENLPTVISAVLGINTVYILRDVFKNLRLWRKGASERERGILAYTVEALGKCHDELDQTQDERDEWRQKVGRRDHIILANGLTLPRDGARGIESDGPNTRT